MPVSPLWVARSPLFTSGATGTTSLVITKPVNTADGDIIIGGISHRSAAFGTWPAGWTLIDRVLEGTIRGELYWKRASGEGANYTITGLDTVATGVMESYKGGAVSGDAVHLFASDSFTGAGVTHAPNMVVTAPNVLLVHLLCRAVNATSPSITTDQVVDTGLTSEDVAIATFGARKHQASATGGGASVSLRDNVKILPGNTGISSVSGQTVDRVVIWAAILPDTTTNTTGTNYYLSNNYPGDFLMGYADGEWDSTWDGPTGNEYIGWTWLLKQTKPGSGPRTVREMTNNREAGENMLLARWMTPPLQAQTIAGTLDFLNKVEAAWSDRNLGFTTDSDVVYRLHAYITVGQSTAVRHVLLDKYVDPIGNKWGFAAAWKSLNAAQALTSGACLDGDSIMVEIGCQIINSPTPAPVYVPADWTYMTMLVGATLNNAGSTAVGAQDGFIGAFTGDEVPFLSFSQTILEKTLTDPAPTNTTCATATAITTFPFYDLEKNTNLITTLGRELWYTWTPTEATYAIFHTFGSHGGVILTLYKGTCAGLSSAGADVVQDNYGQGITSKTLTYLYGQPGTTYFFRLYQNDNAVNHLIGGGSRSFSGVLYQAPTNNDIFLPTSSYILCYRDDLLINVQVAFDGVIDAFSGIAIDYTKRPLDNFNGGVHIKDRLYVAVFSGSAGLGVFPDNESTHGGDYIEVLDVETLNSGESEINYMFDSLGSDNSVSGPNRNEHMASLAINSLGKLIVGWFGDGFRRVAASFASFQDRVSQSIDAELNVVDAVDGCDGFAPPVATATRHAVTLEAGGTNYIELDPIDGTTLYYCSGDWYFPSGLGQKVFRFDVDSGTQLPEFATIPATTGRNPGVKGLHPIPFTTELLVCNGNQVVRLNAAGAVIQTYTPSDPVLSQSLADVEITSEGDAFWVVDEQTTTLFKFDLESGAELVKNWVKCGYGSLTSFVIYRTEGFQPPGGVTNPPAGCPVTNLEPRAVTPLHGCPPSTLGV